MKVLYIFVDQNDMPIAVPVGKSLEVRSTPGGMVLALDGTPVFATPMDVYLEIKQRDVYAPDIPFPSLPPSEGTT